MYPILSAEAALKIKQKIIHEIGIPDLLLIESAGKAAAQIICKNYKKLLGKNISIFCGDGFKGSCGLAIARNLLQKNIFIEIVLTQKDLNIGSESFLLNLKILNKIINYTNNIKISIFSSEINYESNLIIDAITSINENSNQNLNEIITHINNNPAHKIALDLPSGLSSQNSLISVKADTTIVFGAPQINLLTEEGLKVAGKLKIASMGIPQKFLIETAQNRNDCAFQIELSDLRSWLPKHNFTVHKYQRGAALIIAGSKNMSGAAYMASMASAKIGAGIVTCACPEEIQEILSIKFTEIITISLSNIKEFQNKSKAVLIGCGMGEKPQTQEFILDFVQNILKPLVIDADGLNALSTNTDLISKFSQGQWILTPHMAEFKRLIKQETIENPLELARKYAQIWNCILVLKGMPTIIASPDGKVFINSSNNKVLSKAGTGDILAGFCVGLLAQGLKPLEAALCATYLGGAAADEYLKKHNQATFLATDLLKELDHVLHKIN